MNPIQSAEDEYSSGESEVYSLEEFMEYAGENPNSVVNSIQYLINAIEYFGRREVIEYGEELERYKFFDDPVNNGEHAILGNTEELNDFVESLKRKASKEGENNKIIWFTGPTATGKSELKRCLLNGLQAYAETEEGKRYTLEWSLDSLNQSPMTYGGTNDSNRNWYRSPVHVNPLAVLPEKTREEFIEDIESETEFPIKFNNNLDPFSRVTFEELESRYDDFSDIVSEDHLRVVSYKPEIGDGFGVLHSEDSGEPKQKIVGSWMRDSAENYVERGKRNAQRFTYDGVVSQGNSLISLVEDAQHHSAVFSKLMNVCEEDMVKLDNKISMDLDTVIICISNPDFEAGLREYEDSGNRDPHKALRRRLEKYEFEYLTSLALETQLLLKHLTKDNIFWDDENQEEILDKISTPIEKFGAHFSPHAVETAAYFDVYSRLGESNISKVDRIEYYDRGYVVDEGGVEDFEDLEIQNELDGESGIPVTYTVEVLSSLAQEKDVIMPEDVIEAMNDMTNTSPVFSESDASDISMDKMEVSEYAYNRLENDVLEAMIGDNAVTSDEIESYVESLFEWDEGTDDYDPYELRQFEQDYFNTNESVYGEDAEPTSTLRVHRNHQIIRPLNKFFYDNKDEYEGEVPVEESSVFDSLLKDKTWERVKELYEDIDFKLWKDPPSGSQTEEVKSKTIENLQEMGYTEESARKASKEVVGYMEVVERTPYGGDEGGS